MKKTLIILALISFLAVLVVPTTVWATAPTVTAVNPTSGSQGATLNVTITGTNFTGTTVVSFGAETATNSFTVVSDTHITANITIAGTATLGARTVMVINPDGPGTCFNCFAVTAAPPPIVCPAGKSACQAAVTGAEIGCKCGTGTTTAARPWCCAAGNAVFADQAGCLGPDSVCAAPPPPPVTAAPPPPSGLVNCVKLGTDVKWTTNIGTFKCVADGQKYCLFKAGKAVGEEIGAGKCGESTAIPSTQKCEKGTTDVVWTDETTYYEQNKSCLYDGWGMIALFNGIGVVTNWIFVFVTVIVILMLLLGAFEIVTAGGVVEKVTKGRTYIIYGLIGFFVALLAKAIPSIVKNILGM